MSNTKILIMLQKLCVCSLLLDNGGQFKSSFRTSCNDLATKPDWKRGNAGSTVGILFIKLNLFIVSPYFKMFLKEE